MAAGGGVAVIPWYATVWRGDRFEAAVLQIAPIALRYGATEYEVLRSREDRYRFRQSATFERKLDFERYWYGPELEAFRTEYSSWYQVPIVYEWYDRIDRGALEAETAPALDAE
jgi:hypothetical protein